MEVRAPARLVQNSIYSWYFFISPICIKASLTPDSSDDMLASVSAGLRLINVSLVGSVALAFRFDLLSMITLMILIKTI